MVDSARHGLEFRPPVSRAVRPTPGVDVGLAGWVAVGAVVVVADAVAIATGRRTMSQAFRSNREWGTVALVAVAAHLLYREASA